MVRHPVRLAPVGERPGRRRHPGGDQGQKDAQGNGDQQAVRKIKQGSYRYGQCRPFPKHHRRLSHRGILQGIHHERKPEQGKQADQFGPGIDAPPIPSQQVNDPDAPIETGKKKPGIRDGIHEQCHQDPCQRNQESRHNPPSDIVRFLKGKVLLALQLPDPLLPYRSQKRTIHIVDQISSRLTQVEMVDMSAANNAATIRPSKPVGSTSNMTRT